MHRFLVQDGLTPALFRSLTSLGVVLLATLRTDRAHALGLDRTPDGQPVDPLAELANRVLDHAVCVQLDRRWSDEEIERAREFEDKRLEEAAEHADEFGIAEYLAAGPQILRDYQRARAPGGHPRAAALIAAAVDLVRAGLVGGLPKDLVVGVHEHYLNQWGGQRLRPEPLGEALTWATELRCGAASPLLPGDTPDTLEAFDYLVDKASAIGEPVPPTVWQAALAHTDDQPACYYVVSTMAWHLGEERVAVQAWRRLADQGYGPARFASVVTTTRPATLTGPRPAIGSR
jgi:hypothetical protein